MEFLKYLYRYFVPREPDKKLFPVYSEEGHVISYIRRRIAVKKSYKIVGSNGVAGAVSSVLPELDKETPLYTAAGDFVGWPAAKKYEIVSSNDAVLSVPPRLDKRIPLYSAGGDLLGYLERRPAVKKNEIVCSDDEVSPAPPGPGKELIPVYSAEGDLLSYNERPIAVKKNNIVYSNAPTVVSRPPLKEEYHYKLLPDGSYVPVTLIQPNSATSRTHTIAHEWDGWPNGFFEQDFTWEEARETFNLRVHWATYVGGGDRRGDEFANRWELGKRSSRKCLGIIECYNPICDILVRPQTSTRGIDKQLAQSCECGAALFHRKCTVVSYLWRWSHGIHYSNGGYHTHSRPKPLHVIPLHGSVLGYSGMREWRVKASGSTTGRIKPEA